MTVERYKEIVSFMRETGIKEQQNLNTTISVCGNVYE